MLPEQREGERLMSRSQAKSLAARFGGFERVTLDFEGVSSIGPAFADELFRVYDLEHPEVRLIPVNAAPAVSQMIGRALAGRREAH
jgi:STAS-like domain of unknown function (DUF4325)